MFGNASEAEHAAKHRKPTSVGDPICRPTLHGLASADAVAASQWRSGIHPWTAAMYERRD